MATAVRDWTGKEYPLQATISYDYELNGNQSISATILPSEVNRRFIADMSEMWTVIDHFGVEQKIVYLQRRGQGEEQSVQIKGVPLFFDVLDSTRIYERVDKHMTAQEAFTRIFDSTGFTFVLGDTFDAVEWEGFGEGESRLESFKRALDRYGAEFTITGKQVTLKRLIGRELQVMYRHRLNASNITLEHDASALWTYAKGFGDYGNGEGSQDWQDAKLVREYTSPLAQVIGERHAPPIKNGNITTAATMDAELKKLVDESLKISVTADIHDLRKQGYPIGQPEVGDRVYLIDERIGLNEQVRVVDMKLTLDWRGNVRDISLTFGTPGLSRRYQSNLSTAISAIADALDGRKPLPMTALDERIREISEIINGNSDSVFKYSANGVTGWNGDNPNYMTRYVGDAIGFSKDGGATYRTAMSAELGIVADMITAGHINVGNVVIIGEDNYFYWDGNGLTAIDPKNLNRQVTLNSSGLNIKGGAIRIARPDGYVTVMDGIVRSDFTITGCTPPFRSPEVGTSGYFLYTNAMSTPVDLDFISFRHDARYLKIRVGLYSQNAGTFTTFSVFPAGSTSPAAVHRSTNSDPNGTEALIGTTLTIDLGVPTGENVGFYLRLSSGSTTSRAHARIIQMWKEG